MNYIELKGNLLLSDCDYICHQVNCQSVMMSGIAKSIRDKWPQVYKDYLSSCKGSDSLGTYSLSEISKNKFIVNIFGQNYYGTDKRYTDYEALYSSIKLFRDSLFEPKVIGFPYLMSCDRAGGNWNIVSVMIKELFHSTDHEIRIYKFNLGDKEVVSSDKVSSTISGPPVVIYTDGSALGNPGKGGYGVVMLCGSGRKELSQGYQLTTNNRMELMGAIVGLESLKRPSEVTIYSDSKYVVDSVEKGWLFNWERDSFCIDPTLICGRDF